MTDILVSGCLLLGHTHPGQHTHLEFSTQGLRICPIVGPFPSIIRYVFTTRNLPTV